MFFVKRSFIVLLTVFFVFSPFYKVEVSAYNNVKTPYTIVIDAGHGGKDKGSTSFYTGVYESDLNLQLSLMLGEVLRNAGFKVIQTRLDENSLSKNPLGFVKLEDMEERKKIIETSDADMVLSIHMNEFLAGKNQNGAQVFYENENEDGKKLSGFLQTELNKINKKKRSELGGEFFILKCTRAPSVIIECGFLSNEEEEKLLQTKEHQEKICHAILVGIMQYFYSFSV